MIVNMRTCQTCKYWKQKEEWDCNQDKMVLLLFGECQKIPCGLNAPWAYAKEDDKPKLQKETLAYIGYESTSLHTQPTFGCVLHKNDTDRKKRIEELKKKNALKRYHERRAIGQCTKCRLPAEEGRSLCVQHRDVQRKWDRERRQTETPEQKEIRRLQKKEYLLRRIQQKREAIQQQLEANPNERI